MIKYAVHFEYQGFKRNTNTTKLCRGIRTVAARNEDEAIAKVRHTVHGSFGHWVNRLANETVS
jgi:hypothetical protein